MQPSFLACGSKIGLKSLSREEVRQLSECYFQVQCKYIQLSIRYIASNSLCDYASGIYWQICTYIS